MGIVGRDNLCSADVRMRDATNRDAEHETGCGQKS